MQRASGCKSQMASPGCIRCGGSQVAGVVEGGRGPMAAAAGEEVVCIVESRGER